MREQLEYAIVSSLFAIAKRTPKKVVYGLFSLLAGILYIADKRRRNLTKENLRQAGLSPRLAWPIYQNFAKTTAEILFIFHNRFDFSSIEGSFTPKTEKPKIFVTAHFGNWEALAHFLAQSGYPMAVVAREGNNTLIERNFSKPFRQKYGNKVIYKHGAMRGLFKELKSKNNIGLLIDQKAGRDGISMTFLGRKCMTLPTVALLAKKFDVEVVPVFLVREGGKLKLIQKDFSCKGCSVEEYTQKLNDILEEVVRAYPEQWFWMHNRWKVG
ncbi:MULTISPECIES: lysophospholipid acyltransferase family protein [unclassified Nitratiruptor]|uniref:lysophospholipid acyltransferase family protein n=1 Tax=unclassified Nitratiruptor TaxID=2624044 RepID=UPI00191604F3|nr:MULTISPECIES: lysophospholipid acyltransferase family protein [unclassified Nitratiruptor]BCD60746.1 Kdo2-lipid IVA lauroyltransferase/acyltransferase [Nitratiruptor sp. YY08-10]BCD64678.1 Kdo2-lipid IVA lauroyltransferase/acyltransferase [Nitratiruptor sp. YY08-14]